MLKRKILILGAAGRDFHNFNVCYRGDNNVHVVGFTAAQIPDIADRRYPAALAGPLYPKGIPIYPETKLVQLIKDHHVDECIFSYSDVSNQYVMNLSAIVNAAGAGFVLPGPGKTQIKSTKPVISVGAVRTGCGKSQTARRIIEILMAKDLKVVAIRHPMPYGDLAAQIVQRFASLEDIDKHHCTVEEMEEYEPHVVRGNVIYAGVDYEAVVRAAEQDSAGCDIIVWDGGNNDIPFLQSDLHVTVVDPHRPGHECTYFPGNANLRMADVVVINKMDSADAAGIDTVRRHIAELNPRAIVVDAASALIMQDPLMVKGKKVLVVEDGPTLTHGEMKIGAGTVAAKKYGAAVLVDPRPFTVGRLSQTFQIYPGIGCVLPAMGYGPEQLKDLETTINRTACDAVVIGTPIDLTRIININNPSTRVFYSLQEIGQPDMDMVLSGFLARRNFRVSL
ncbi:MAG: cyclic 2,3-diphosphoglycerate synthase [Desulfobacterales bacterium]|jgi:predicted GTPase|nr:cyclic 2,3-diphosphoglycerate synthase [Desulfobacterales bacterium]